jgi:hypothetical protein
LGQRKVHKRKAILHLGPPIGGLFSLAVFGGRWQKLVGIEWFYGHLQIFAALYPLKITALGCVSLRKAAHSDRLFRKRWRRRIQKPAF